MTIDYAELFREPFAVLAEADGTGKPCIKIPCDSENQPCDEAAATVDQDDDPNGGSQT